MRVIIPREKPDFQIKRADFKQAFNEVMQEIDTKVLWKMEVVKVLHELAEIYLVDFFEKAQLAAEHAGKVVVRKLSKQLFVILLVLKQCRIDRLSACPQDAEFGYLEEPS